MKYFLIIVGLFAALVAAVMFLPAKDGKPLLSSGAVESFVQEQTQQLPGMEPTDADGEVVPTMFRWKDSKGRWQYGDRPPPGVPAEPVAESEIQTLQTYDQQQQ